MERVSVWLTKNLPMNRFTLVGKTKSVPLKIRCSAALCTQTTENARISKMSRSLPPVIVTQATLVKQHALILLSLGLWDLRGHIFMEVRHSQLLAILILKSRRQIVWHRLHTGNDPDHLLEDMSDYARGMYEQKLVSEVYSTT